MCDVCLFNLTPVNCPHCPLTSDTVLLHPAKINAAPQMHMVVYKYMK